MTHNKNKRGRQRRVAFIAASVGQRFWRFKMATLATPRRGTDADDMTTNAARTMAARWHHVTAFPRRDMVYQRCRS